MVNSTQTATTERVCFRVYVDPAAAATCNNQWGCCSDELEKFELLANKDECYSAPTDVRLNGVSTSYQWDGQSPTLKFPQLNVPYNAGAAGGVRLCFTIRGPCTRFTQLCPGGACRVATFNPPGNACCPPTPMGFMP